MRNELKRCVWLTHNTRADENRSKYAQVDEDEVERWKHGRRVRFIKYLPAFGCFGNRPLLCGEQFSTLFVPVSRPQQE